MAPKHAVSGPAPRAPNAGLLALEAAVLGLCVLTAAAWFAGVPGWLPPGLPFAGLLLLALARLGLARPRLPSPRAETLLCLAAAVGYRLPALLHPWGWVNRDGAYGAFVALHILQGTRPAPVFTEGASYQGTLKGHLAALLALVTGLEDLSLLMTAASLVLYLIFLAATMALARRVAGRIAALAAGLYLAFGPRFLTVFSLNCVGQYVDVLALGGLALALLAGTLDDGRKGAPARGRYLAVGLFLGIAFWQQPVALSYLAVALLALLARTATWRDPWTLLVPAGVALGALPVLLWNAQHDWATGDMLGRDPEELRAQAEALPFLIRRTVTRSFPVLAGLSPGHPWADASALPPAASSLLPALLLGYLLLKGRTALASLRRGEPRSEVVAPLLMAFCLALFWAVASGKVYLRPRYLLPVMAATAVHLGTVAAWAWSRSQALAVIGLTPLIAVNIAGTMPRFEEGRLLAEEWRGVVRSLEEKGIRTGYADFSIAAPVTMFTSERIVLSPRLGPTPAYESEAHARRVDEAGPDAFVLLPEDDPERFADRLRALGVSFRFERHPLPVFYGFSRRVDLHEVAGFRAAEVEPRQPPEE